MECIYSHSSFYSFLSLSLIPFCLFVIVSQHRLRNTKACKNLNIAYKVCNVKCKSIYVYSTLYDLFTLISPVFCITIYSEKILFSNNASSRFNEGTHWLAFLNFLIILNYLLSSINF